jgi:hypothetical protein
VVSITHWSPGRSPSKPEAVSRWANDPSFIKGQAALHAGN